MIARISCLFVAPCLLPLVLSGAALANPPANDSFATAINLGSATSVSIAGSNREATKETGEPTHADDPGGASVWYTWTSLSLGRVRLDTCDSTFDTLLAVYTGLSVNSLSPVASNDQACGNGSKVAFDFLPGVTYRIAIDGWSDNGQRSAEQGTINLLMRSANPPANDRFAAAQNLGSASSAKFLLTNIDASKEAGEPNHAADPGGASVWYRWTAPSSGPVRADTCNTLWSFDTLLAVYRGSQVNALSEMSSNDDACAFGRSRTVFPAVADQTYFIAVDGWSQGGAQAADEDYVDLNLKVLHPPANDDFAGAEDLGGGPTAATSGTNIDATREAGEPDAWVHERDPRENEPGGSSVWYRWTAPSSGRFKLDLCGSDFDLSLAIFAGTALSGLNRIANSATGCGPYGALQVFDAVAGHTYRFMVDGDTEQYFRPPTEGAIDLKLYPGPVDEEPPQPSPPQLSGGGSLAMARVAPTTELLARPPRRSRQRRARFVFRSDDLGATFECKLDRASYQSCSSPKIYRLHPGRHVVRVRARTIEGQLDLSPAQMGFVILK